MPNKNKKHDKGVNSVAAGVTGAVVGAGVAVSAVQALGSKKVQKKAKQVIGIVKNQALDYLDKNEVKEKITRVSDKAKDK